MRPSDWTTAALEARRVRGIQVAFAVAALFAVLRFLPTTQGLGFFATTESLAYDRLFSYSRSEPPRDIAIVAIDDKSLQAYGRFQGGHRNIYAAIVDRLPDARAIAFDVLFPEPDDDPDWSRARTPHPIPLRGPLAGRTADQVFADAMRRHGRVVLSVNWREAQQGEGTDREALEHAAYPHTTGALPRPDESQTLALPTPILRAAAAGIGFVDLIPDRDGVYRRFRPLMSGPESLTYPHLGVALAAVATGRRPADVVADVPRRRFQLAPGTRHLTLDRNGATLINYCGPQSTVPTYSVVDVIENDAVRDQLKGKIVLVGATAAGLYDIRPGPYRASGRLMCGVETNANIVDTLLYRRPLRDQSGSPWWAMIVIALGTLIGAILWFTSDARAAVTISTGLVLLVAIPSFIIAWRLLDAWIPYGAVTLGTIWPLLLGLSGRLTAERQLIQRQFDVYVSPHVLRELMQEPDLVRHSQRRAVSVLFVDVRGSTTLSEQIAPEIWVAQLNEYLTQMSLAIFAYDGYLDKFMGDGVMAVWNAFGAQPDDHAELAVRAGSQMLRRLDLLNRKWELTPDRTPLRIGIGVHSGEAIIGNVGSDERVQYTAIGDTVNTAARIADLCKKYEAEFIVSGDTRQLLGEDVEVRGLGEAEIRGRAGGVGVYEVILDRPVPTQSEGREMHAPGEGETEAEQR